MKRENYSNLLKLPQNTVGTIIIRVITTGICWQNHYDTATWTPPLSRGVPISFVQNS